MLPPSDIVAANQAGPLTKSSEIHEGELDEEDKESLVSCRDASKGQALAEYALILCLVMLVCVAALSMFGGAVRDLFAPASAAL